MRTYWFALLLVLCGIAGGRIQTLAVEDPREAVSIYGFVSQGYLLSDPNDVYAETREGTFQFNEFGLTILTQLSDRLHTGIQLLSRDLGDIGNNTVDLDWAVADYRWKDWLGFRGGILKVPWGMYNETRDVEMLRTSIFLPSSLYGEEVRDVYDAIQGIGFYGSFPVWKLGNLNYQFQYGDKSVTGGCAPFEASEVRLESLDVLDIYVGMLEWETPLDGLRLRQTSGEYTWRIRGSVALPPEVGAGRMPFVEEGDQTFAIVSAEYTSAKLTLAAEQFWVWDAIEEEEVLEGELSEEGWYVSMSYRPTDWWELGTYYSVFYGDGSDKSGESWQEMGLPAYLAWQKDFAVTTRFDIGEHWTIKFEGHLMDGAARLPLTSSDLPERDTILLAVKTTFNF